MEFIELFCVTGVCIMPVITIFFVAVAQKSLKNSFREVADVLCGNHKKTNFYGYDYVGVSREWLQAQRQRQGGKK